MTSNDLFLKGASLGPGKGTLYIVTGDKYQEKIAHSFPDKTARSPYFVLCVDDRREESEDQDNLGQQGCEPSYEGSFFGYSR